MLYSLSRSPYSVDLFALLDVISKDDDLLFIQDGVIALLQESDFLKFNKLTSLFVLEEDLIARGLESLISERAKRINYQDFVHLTAKHKQYIAW